MKKGLVIFFLAALTLFSCGGNRTQQTQFQPQNIAETSTETSGGKTFKYVEPQDSVVKTILKVLAKSSGITKTDSLLRQTLTFPHRIITNRKTSVCIISQTGGLNGTTTMPTWKTIFTRIFLGTEKSLSLRLEKDKKN